MDLNRYAGKWYEIARLPNRFERECESDVTAEYTPRPDGKIRVVNSCKSADGKTKKAKGTAKLANKSGPNSKFRVTFFWPFYGDYWILDIDPEYQWALIGGPDRDYLWILSRSAELDRSTLDRIIATAKMKGFETSKLVRPKQG